MQSRANKMQYCSLLNHSQVCRIQCGKVLQGENPRPLEYPDPEGWIFAWEPIPEPCTCCSAPCSIAPCAAPVGEGVTNFGNLLGVVHHVHLAIWEDGYQKVFMRLERPSSHLDGSGLCKAVPILGATHPHGLAPAGRTEDL